MSRLAIRGLTVALSLGFCLVLILVALELFYPKPLRPFIADTQTIYRLRPGSVRRFQRHPAWGGNIVESLTNQQGFRGPEILPQSDLFRIVVYGDSFVQGEFSEEHDTFARQLERRLEPGVEVINAGTIGFGPDQILRRVEQELDWLQPDLVIVTLFADNDLGDLIRNKLYRIDGQGGLISQSPRTTDSISRGLGTNRDPAIRRLMRKAWYRWLDLRRTTEITNQAQPSRPVDTIGNKLELARREFQDYMASGPPVVKTIRYDFYDADVALEPESESGRYKRTLLAAVLKQINNRLALAQVASYVLVVPSPIDVVDGWEELVDREQYPEYDPRFLSNEFAKIAVDAGFETINLFDNFARTSSTSPLYFGYGDDHWNEEGQRIAADLVAARVLEDVERRPGAEY